MQINNFIIKELNINSVYKVISKVPILFKPYKLIEMNDEKFKIIHNKNNNSYNSLFAFFTYCSKEKK